MIPNLLYLILRLGWVLISKNTSSHYLVSTGIQGLALIWMVLSFLNIWQPKQNFLFRQMHCMPIALNILLHQCFIPDLQMGRRRRENGSDLVRGGSGLSTGRRFYRRNRLATLAEVRQWTRELETDQNWISGPTGEGSYINDVTYLEESFINDVTNLEGSFINYFTYLGWLFVFA